MNPTRLFRSLVGANLVIFIGGPLLLYGLYQVRPMINPVLSGLLVAYLCFPLVKLTSKFGIPRGITVTVIILVIVGSMSFAAYSLFPKIKSEARVFAHPDQATAQAGSTLGKIIETTSKQLQKYNLIPPELEYESVMRAVLDWVLKQSATLIGSAGNLAVKGGQFLFVFLFVLFFALYDGDKIYHGIVQLFPNSFFESGVFILNKTEAIFGDYMRGLVVENLILGLISYLLLLPVCGLSELSTLLALLIAIVIGITNAVRVIGPIIGGAIGALLVLFTSTDIHAMLGVIAVAAIIQVIDNAIVLPLVMKDQVNVHPLLCTLGVIMGGMLGGVLGMILAIPVIAGFKVFYRVLMVEMKRFTLEANVQLDYLRE